MTPKLITIVGPTAIGKTDLSIKLAQHFNCEIISSDSRQFYKEMFIGTAVPTEEELKSVKHHFIQHKSISETYTVGDFETEAIERLSQLYEHNPNVVMVGGSGLYVKAVTDGLDSFPKVDKSIREELNSTLDIQGLKILQEKLKSLDPIAFETIAMDNPHRVIRALEICIASGKPYSSFLSSSKKTRNFKNIMIGLTADRSVIYDRINQRVDIMMSNGLLEEAKGLIPYKHLNALNTVGYKELFRYLEGEITLDFAISEIKKNTRRFAKRQLTWFRKNEDIKWFNFETATREIANYIENQE